VRAFDPVANSEARELYAGQPNVSFVDDPYLATEQADALLIVTEWKTFRSPDFSRLRKQLKNPLIFDGRNIYEPAMLHELGFRYYGIGRSN
jgi:UDPglucose 6-dehydrogenase